MAQAIEPPGARLPEGDQSKNAAIRRDEGRSAHTLIDYANNWQHQNIVGTEKSLTSYALQILAASKAVLCSFGRDTLIKQPSGETLHI